VESAITPKVRVLLVAGDRCGDLWHFVVGHPETFEIELESNGDDALQRYRKHSPYDLVLTGFRIAGMDGSDLALAVRQENPAQRITMITANSSSAVRRSIQRKLGDIPVLRQEDLFNAMGELRRAERLPEGEAQALLNSVDAASEKKRSNALKTANLIKKKLGHDSLIASCHWTERQQRID
jgi:CheY-like chemotaxis protein